MSPDPPPVVSGRERQLVFPWEVPIEIDGLETVIHGELIWIPSVSSLPGLLAGVIALLPLLAWKRGHPLVPSIVIGSAAVLTGIVIVAEAVATPADARAFPIWVVYAVVALIAAGFAVTRSRTSSTAAARANLFAALTLLLWAIVAIDLLWLPILPSVLPAPAVRGVFGMILWASIAVIVLSIADEGARPSGESPLSSGIGVAGR